MEHYSPTTAQFYEELGEIISKLDQFDVSREDIVELLLSLKYNRIYQRIPESLHLKLVNYFCLSSGAIQEIIHSLRLGKLSDILDNITLESELFQISSSEFSKVLKCLADTGYSLFPRRLPRSVCQTILADSYAARHSCLVVQDNNTIGNYTASHLSELLDGTISARMEEADILQSRQIRQVVNDPVILSIATAYLRSVASIRHVSLWHSFPSPKGLPESELAQLFHFDLDEFRWLKLFVFLTDVDESSGPHVYIPGTHKVGSKDPSLLQRGYSRIIDTDMSKYHPEHTWRKIICPAGTLCFADTRCWHKGSPLLQGSRTVLQPEYAPSSFSKQFF